ncbi:hypothetical protein EDB85DRAFT_1073586 [Lactarius pseudohatsudake]|nr:hypothetical protein EDB85DRAFT_1073586 [Lactarius pseudohatsudake]
MSLNTIALHFVFFVCTAYEKHVATRSPVPTSQPFNAPGNPHPSSPTVQHHGLVALRCSLQGQEHAVQHTPTGTAIGASASADVASSKDDHTQSDVNDVSNDSNDGIDAEIETMNREMERYVSRSPPYNPASGNKAWTQVRNPPRSQGVATSTPYQPSGAPKGRPPAATANAVTTAQPKRKS